MCSRIKMVIGICCRLWDVRTSKASATVKLKKSDFLFLAWNPGQPEIVAAVHEDNEIFFIDLRKQRVLKTMASKGQVNSWPLAFSALPKLLLIRTSAACIGPYLSPNLENLQKTYGISCLMTEGRNQDPNTLQFPVVHEVQR